MTKVYDTLDQYLDDLDRIKEQVASETAGMTATQVRAYFAKAGRELEKITGRKLRVRRPGRRARAARR